MLEKHQLKPLSDAVSDAWKNVIFAKVNELDVRLRVVADCAANFHAYADSDELFCCLEGVAHLDTADGATKTLKPHELAVVPATRHTAEPSSSSMMPSRGEQCRTSKPSPCSWQRHCSWRSLQGPASSMLRRERLPAAGPKGSHRASAWVSAALYTFLPARSVSPHS